MDKPVQWAVLMALAVGAVWFLPSLWDREPQRLVSREGESNDAGGQPVSVRPSGNAADPAAPIAMDSASVDVHTVTPPAQRTSSAAVGSVEVSVSHSADTWGPFVVRLEDGRGLVRLAGPELAVFEHVAGGPTAISLEREGWWPLQQTVDVVPGQTTRVDIRMRPRLVVTGTVLGRADGAPIPEFDVELEARVHASPQPYTVVSTGARVVNQEGTYAVSEETPNVAEQRVTVRAAGHLPASSDWIQVVGDTVQVPSIHLQRSDDCSVVGVVVTELGAAVPHARVHFVPGSQPPHIQSSVDGLSIRAVGPFGQGEEALVDDELAPILAGLADENGRFELEVPCGATGQIVAWAPAHSAALGAAIEVHERGSGPLRIALAARVDLRIQRVVGAHLQRTVELERILVRQRGQATVAETREVYPGNPAIQFYEAAVEPDSPGAVEVWGRRQGPEGTGYASLRLARVTFRAGNVGEVPVLLAADQGGADLRAQLRLPEPVKFEHTLVALVAPNAAQPIARGFVDAEGGVELVGIDEGNYTFCVLGHGQTARSPLIWQTNVELHAGAMLDLGTLDLMDLRATRVQGAAGAVWSVTRPEGAISPLAAELLLRPESDGSLLLYGLPPGLFDAHEQSSGRRGKFTVDTSPAQSVQLQPID
ncbi:MAG: hypothetical protein GC161_16700 [Planctomycetaceae bacterium]|nr:hypothetical protein [Planctomycetaceae bacterium]